jgi:hypothetical protein
MRPVFREYSEIDIHTARYFSSCHGMSLKYAVGCRRIEEDMAGVARNFITRCKEEKLVVPRRVVDARTFLEQANATVGGTGTGNEGAGSRAHMGSGVLPGTT